MILSIFIRALIIPAMIPVKVFAVSFSDLFANIRNECKNIINDDINNSMKLTLKSTDLKCFEKWRVRDYEHSNNILHETIPFEHHYSINPDDTLSECKYHKININSFIGSRLWWHKVLIINNLT